VLIVSASGRASTISFAKAVLVCDQKWVGQAKEKAKYRDLSTALLTMEL
jgi:hypothetical protein